MRTLPLALLAMLAALTAAAQAADADLPPAGRSRFDQLVGQGPVPYPFSRLRQRIETGMQPDAGGLPPLKITLIPLGRSLQRDAGAPDFFRFPRVVAAADGLNRPGVIPLKDRLFLGFHEKGQVIEVISYNDVAGRFEFQVVRDYAAGKMPRLYYARRSLCLACHQNAGPMFARPLWDETPANPAIAGRLRAARRDFYGVRVSGTDVAYFIDAATERANLFSVWQTLWQRGCGTGDDGDRCRMDAFSAALDYARAGTLPAVTRLRQLDRTWKARWPRGLPIPNPDLPNRDPLAALPDPATDPLLLRPPLAVWQTPDKTAFIVGLAGMIDDTAVKQLRHRNLAPALQQLRARGDFGARPFNSSLLQALQTALGQPTRTTASTLPPARSEPRPRDTGTRALFRTHCASCHDTTLPSPPPFLHGSAAEVEANLDHCAPRIFFRLSMAGIAEAARPVSPMPPAAALLARGIDAHAWAGSPERAALERSIVARLRVPVPAQLLQQPYSSLPSCLPARSQHAALKVPTP